MRAVFGAWARLAAAVVTVVWPAACSDDGGSGAGPRARDAGALADRGPGMDASRPDATAPSPQAAVPDAGGDAQVDPPDAGGDAGPPMPVEMPMSLHDTGLYDGDSTDTLAAGVLEFAPREPLWSDGAVKRRFLYLPPGTRIDNTNSDAWIFPVGTRAWKEFVEEGVKIETRLLEKRDSGWFMMAYAWNAEQTEARAAIDGVTDALGTHLDIPAAVLCVDCHGGSADALLGVTAVQLGFDAAPLSLTDLDAADLLSTAPAQDTYVLPGDADARFALGYLNANCAHCHNPRAPSFGRAGEMNLLLTTDALATVEATTTHATTVGVDLQASLAGYAQRIVAGQPAMSGLVARMAADKAEDHAMPPLATEIVDTDALGRIEAWIAAM